MTQLELQKQVEQMTMESNALHDWLMDIALYASGAVSYVDLLQMPIARIQRLQDRLKLKLETLSGVSSATKMTPGETGFNNTLPNVRNESR